MWDEETPTIRFMRRLVRERAEEMIGDPQYMRALRHDNETAVRYQRRFGKIWEEHGTNVYKLIAKACGDSPWDSEDEQKTGAVAVEKKDSPLKEKYHDDLAPARQAGARVGLDVLQGEFEKGLEVLEVEEGKADPKEKGEKSVRGRREGFYRLAGGAPGPQES